MKNPTSGSRAVPCGRPDEQTRKTIKHQISWKIRPVGAELFHADDQTNRQTWHDKANSRFS